MPEWKCNLVIAEKILWTPAGSDDSKLKMEAFHALWTKQWISGTRRAAAPLVAEAWTRVLERFRTFSGVRVRVRTFWQTRLRKKKQDWHQALDKKTEELLKPKYLGTLRLLRRSLAVDWRWFRKDWRLTHCSDSSVMLFSSFLAGDTLSN